jgi:hypothetical protein
MKRIPFALAIMLLCSSCFQHYFKVSATNEWNYAQLASYSQRGKVFVIHSQKDVALLADPSFDSNMIRGRLVNYYTLSVRENSTPYAYVEPSKKAVRYRKSHKKQVLKEVHIDTNDSARTGDSITISKENFVRVKEYKQAKGLTTLSSAGPVAIILAIGFGALLVAGFYAFFGALGLL